MELYQYNHFRRSLYMQVLNVLKNHVLNSDIDPTSPTSVVIWRLDDVNGKRVATYADFITHFKKLGHWTREFVKYVNDELKNQYDGFTFFANFVVSTTTTTKKVLFITKKKCTTDYFIRICLKKT